MAFFSGALTASPYLLIPVSAFPRLCCNLPCILFVTMVVVNNFDYEGDLFSLPPEDPFCPGAGSSPIEPAPPGEGPESLAEGRFQKFPCPIFFGNKAVREWKTG
jgi:hypothetical protein